MLVLISLGVRAAEAQAGAEARPPATGSVVVATPVVGQARRFLGGRTLASGEGAAASLAKARAEHRAMVLARPKLSALNSTWKTVGPMQVTSATYGALTGRVSSVAIDPGDGTGNTVYVGTTGGGVWKSTNAAGAAASVTFAPLTDDLPVFDANAGSSALTSLSIGAVSAQTNGIVLAGTGDPNDALDSYYGAGILRSADGGLTWTLIAGSKDGGTGNHSFVGLGFAGFAWSTANSQLVVAAVSQSVEGAIANATTTRSVMGLYYSTDAGVTWQMSKIYDGSQPVQVPVSGATTTGGVAATSVVWNTVRGMFYAAIRYHGYYASPDGVTWTRLAHQPGANMTAVSCPTAPGTSGSVSCPVFRGALSVQATTGDTFALTTDRNNKDQGLWQDVCGLSGGGCASSVVSFGVQLPSAALETGAVSGVIPQADYDLGLAAVPVGGDTLLFVGTSDLYRCSLAAGCVLRNTTNATNGCGAPAKVASAQHAIATLGAAGLVYLGNDGGLWRSTDNVGETATVCSADDANHFQNLNGGLGSLGEVVSFAEDPTSRSTLLVGLGAIGTATSAGAVAGAWTQLSAGEGGTVAIDPANPLLWYISTAGGVSLKACANGGQCGASDFAGLPTIGPVQTGLDASVLDAPWMLDPATSSNVLIGTCRVWRGPAASGISWPGANQVSAVLGGPPNSACDPTTNPLVRSLAAGGPAVNAGAVENSGSGVLYAGMAGALDGGGAYAGHVFTTARADLATNATKWSDLATSTVTNGGASNVTFNPGAFDVSSVMADPHDATGKTVYVTVMGFSGNGVSSPHVYGSTDGGAHWLNLSSNLPNAPANSLVVDPNDANTVYVALDTGVYVTTAVTSCADTTTNCWSVYGLSLPNAPVVALEAAVQMPTDDGRVGMLRAGTYGRGLWEIPLLTAANPARPAMTLSPTSLSFGSQAVGTISGTRTITVTNSGSAVLVMGKSAATGDFALVDGCAGTTVAVNGTCTIQVQFLPTAQGARTGVLTVYGNVSGGQATAALSGTATAPGDIVLLPITLTFPTTMVGATSAVQNITISNLGGTTATIGTPSVTGDFRISANTCGASLAPSTGCTVSVAFVPTVSGTRTGNVVVTGSLGTQTAALSGLATTPATDSMSPMSLTFGTQAIGTTSVAQQVVLTNAGDVPLTLIAAQITTGDFTAVNGCGNSLNAHSTCSINVAFVPKSVGAIAGVLTVADVFRSQTVVLNGVGVAPPGVSISPVGTMSFAATAVGASSPAQTVTLTNNGGLPLMVQSMAVTGDFAVVSGGTCGTSSVAPMSACTVQVVFTPTAGGARTGSLVITDNAPSSPQTLGLSGAGMDFSLAADGSTTQTVASGKSAVYPLLLSSAAGVSGSVSLSCSGAPANATCVVSPGSATFGSTTLVTVTVATGVTTTAKERHDPGPGRGSLNPLVWAGLLPLGALVMRRRHRMSGLVVLAVMCVGIAGGCGSGRVIPVMGGGTTPVPLGPVTPSGSYTITVTATTSGLTRTMDLSLTVQ